MTHDFETKLLSLQDNMKSFALSLTANKDDAMDLLQETTLKAINNADKYRDNTNLKAWLFTIMRNIFINNYRRDNHSSVIFDKSTDVYHLELSPDISYNNVECSVSVKEITEAIANISDENRIPFTMYVSGYKYDEIAKALDIPLGTIKSRIFFCRKALQKYLREYRQVS